MGSFADYSGCYEIQEEKRPLFVKQMCKLLNRGGMMILEEAKMFGHKITLLRPIEETKGEIHFYFNYFEDDSWESVEFDTEKARLWSGKIGDGEFSDVMEAAYTLYELYDAECGLADKDGSFVNAEKTIGWINHVLGTQYSLGKRVNIWGCIEYDALKRNYERMNQSDLQELLPHDWRAAAGGTDLADLLYIADGTSELTEANVEEGSYPSDILKCRCALEEYFQSTQENSAENAQEQLWRLLKQSYEEREKEQDSALKLIAQLTLYMPARVFVYLTAEIKGMQFWKIWKELHHELYHDENAKQYASQALMEWRREEWKKPVEPIRTEDYLKQYGYFTFYNTPEKLKGKPNYYLSDADRLYWWDGTEEVRIAPETDEWLKKMAEEHKEILKTMDILEDSVSAVQAFMKLLEDINKYYWRILPFEAMFYDFIQNISRKEYAAAVEVLRQVAEDKENREAGEVIQCCINTYIRNKNVIQNAGRLQLKRILSVFANKQLRKMYFDF